jgi:hypothetical protein
MDQTTRFRVLCAAMLLGLAIPGSGAAFVRGEPAAEISGGPWINSGPLTLADLRGRVVLVEFWTYG